MRRTVKPNVLNTLLYARRDWDKLLDQINEVDMGKPGVFGQWSIKDIIAHVTWYEKEMENMLRTKKLGGSELWELPPEQRDEAIYQKNKFKPLDEVKQESLKTLHIF